LQIYRDGHTCANKESVTYPGEPYETFTACGNYIKFTQKKLTESQYNAEKKIHSFLLNKCGLRAQDKPMFLKHSIPEDGFYYFHTEFTICGCHMLLSDITVDEVNHVIDERSVNAILSVEQIIARHSESAAAVLVVSPARSDLAMSRKRAPDGEFTSPLTDLLESEIVVFATLKEQKNLVAKVYFDLYDKWETRCNNGEQLSFDLLR
jgi:hypothetical protein